MNRVLSGLILAGAGLLTVVFRRPSLGSASNAERNVGFRFGERTMRLTEIMIWVVAGAWFLFAAMIVLLPGR
jgi:hypothetical protein